MPREELKGRNCVSIGMFIFYRLHELGMRHILGVPGDFNLQLLDHIYKVPDLQWVGTCNELNAAYAADGYARIVGIGAFVTTFGVGELSAINGVAGAYSEQIPVIHVVGTTSRMMQKAQVMIHHTLSENWDHTTYQRMSEPVRSASAFLTDETTAAAEIDRVLETAVKTRLPVYLFVPVDVSDIIIDASPLMKPLNVEVHNVGREADEDKVVLEIIQLIEKASNPGIIVDMLVQRHGLVEDTKSLISLIDAPVYVTPLSKSVIDECDTHFAGLYCGVMSSSPEVRACAERHDIMLHLGPFPTSSNTGSFSNNIPTEKSVKLHPSYCSIGNKSWEGLHFTPVVEKLVLHFSQHPCQRKAKSSLPLPKTINNFEIDESTDPIDHARFWARMNMYLQPGDCVIAEVGTAQFGSLEFELPNEVQYFSQFYFGSIGFTVPALLGALLARKNLGLGGRAILLVGDGSLQLTVQEIGTIIREGFFPTIIVVNNAGYTIERFIHGPQQQYNDISTLWDHQKILSFFGAPKSRSYTARTYVELSKVLLNEDFQKSDCIQLLEVFFEKMDLPRKLLSLGQLAREREAR